MPETTTTTTRTLVEPHANGRTRQNYQLVNRIKAKHREQMQGRRRCWQPIGDAESGDAERMKREINRPPDVICSIWPNDIVDSTFKNTLGALLLLC